LLPVFQIKQVDAGLVNARDAEGRTPLFVCTATGGRSCGGSSGATECMATLLRYRAAVDEADKYGDTPLHMAAKGTIGRSSTWTEAAANCGATVS
jgi:ankyrin repeat protein